MGQTAVSLQTNQHALHVIELDKTITKLEGAVEEVSKAKAKLEGANNMLMNTNVDLENALKNGR